ncbi:endochitinase At2g43590-like [Amaranthus tricolor]|uniref:endochitinase At2g43590-like n=1 Tax=Amaranthus tricolor TaxID=29722 RepID=UPI00258BC40B|nr:endochitinase At2g43590-like [Amaranthus tricolor]
MKIGMGLMMLMLGIICSVLNNEVRAVKVGSVVTPGFFNSIISQADSSCKGKSFYSRAAFLSAAKTFPKFGSGTNLAAKREIAAFFAHVTHETGHFCYKDEIGASTKPYCDRSCTKYPCKAGKSYHGRGPIQLTWNCNYGACGKSLGIDLLKHPELASSNPTVSFKTALWYWMKRVHPVMHNGFGATIRAINGGECNGGNPTAVKNRINYYKKYCKKFDVTPGPKLSC